MGYEGRVQNTSVTFDPGLVDTHERWHALLDQAFVGRYALSGEAFYTRSRGVHTLRDRPRKPDASCARQPVPVAQDAQPVGAVRGAWRAVTRAAPVVREGNELPRGVRQIPHRWGGAARSQSKNATGRPSRKTVFLGSEVIVTDYHPTSRNRLVKLVDTGGKLEAGDGFAVAAQ